MAIKINNTTVINDDLELQNVDVSGSVGSQTISWSAKQTFNGSSSTISSKFLNCSEKVLMNSTSISSTTDAYLSDGVVQYWTSDAGANTTLNLSWSSGTTLNTVLGVGESISAAVMITNGASAYYPTTYKIDGTTITPKWLANSAPTGGNSNSIDVYSFNIIKKDSTPTYTVLVNQTQFK